MSSSETAPRHDFADEQRLQISLEAGRIGTWRLELPHGPITWSENFERLHGFAPGAFGDSLETYQQHIHPDDRVRVLAALRACATEGTDYSADYRLVDPSGATHYVEAHGRLIRDRDGTPLQMLGVCADVTERRELLESEKHARFAAEASELQYRTLAETIPQQVWTALPDGRLDFVNQRVTEYFGRTSADMIDSGWQNVVHPEDLGMVIERWTRSLATGYEYEVEFRLRRRDGAYRWYLGRAIPVRDASHEIVKWLGTNTDIDEKKKSLTMMATQIEVTRLLIDAQTLADVATPMLETVGRNLSWTCAQLWLVDRAFDVVRRSAGWCNVASMQDCQFEQLSSFNQMKHGEGLPGRIWDSKAPAWIADLDEDPNFPRASITRALGLRSAFGFPLIVAGEVSAILELFSMEQRPVDESILTMTQNLGSQIGQFIERQAAQCELRKTLDRLKQLQSVTDAALAHLSLDDLLRDLLAKICDAVQSDVAMVMLADAETHELRPASTFGTASLSPQVRIALGESLSGRVAAEQTTLIVRDVQSQEFIRPEIRALGISSVIGVPLLSGKRLVGVLMVASMTERAFLPNEIAFVELVAERLASAVERSSLYEEAREANRAKDRFLSIASHDLRTPMTGILGWTRILKSETDPALRAEALDWIEKAVRAQTQLIEDLLDSTRIREGKLVLNLETLDLASLLAATESVVRPLAAERGVELVMPPPAEPAMIRGDFARLEQVMWNLVSNAIKFTPRGKTVRTRATVGASDVTIAVEDEGVGIAPESLPHIFKAFEQAEIGKHAGGLGLGLHLVSTIVAMHGGAVEAKSEGTGKGATFTVRLPLANR
ncbi:MAG: PAS domain-containing protein [Thermoanaerobaculia bacterium]